ncbi:hypothetical protein BKA81DRAFT_372755 [Phyllosticta paracitricarpa]
MIHDADAAAASLQLQSEHAIQLLRTHRRRPLLHHLRAGPSWLLQLPRPIAATRRGARGFYNVLIDPMFKDRTEGDDGLVNENDAEARSWVARAMGRGKSVGSIEEVHELIGEVETLAGKGKRGTGGRASMRESEAAIDVVVISSQGKFSAEESEALLQVNSDVPVFALEEAIPNIAALDHFRLVCPIPPFSRHDPDWRATSLPPLPEWLAVSRLESSQAATATTSTLMNKASSRPPALLFAFATPNPPDHACSPSIPSSARSRPQAQERGQSSARALLHNGWAPAAQASPASEGAECVLFIAGSAKDAKGQTRGGNSRPVRRNQQGVDEDGDALLSPDAIRAVAYACPSVDVLAVMAPGVAADVQQGKSTFDSKRSHTRAQKLLRARYWINVGREGKPDKRGAVGRRRGASDSDNWVRVSNDGASQSGGGTGARWYTPWRWPGAGVRWLLNGKGGSGGETKGKKRGLDESDEEEQEEFDEDGEDDEDGQQADDDANNGVVGHEDVMEGDDEDETLDPWRDVQRCNLGGGESRVLV